MIDPPAVQSPVPLRHRLLFWLILGTLSVVLAEGVSFSFPVPFFNLYGLLVVYPLYTLHILVLCSLIYRQKQVSIPILYLAGALIGMYEAYMTKVLWVPTWGQEWTLVIGGVYLMHTMTLVVYWHPVMAFMLPVLIADYFFSAGETVLALPAFAQRTVSTRLGITIVSIAFVAYFGIRQGLNSPHLLASLGAGFAAIAVLFVLGGLWHRLTGSHGYTFRDLLPTRTHFRILAVLLILYYAGHLIFFRPEALPRSAIPHLIVWLIYAVIIGLLLLHLRRSPPAPILVRGLPRPFFAARHARRQRPLSYPVSAGGRAQTGLACLPSLSLADAMAVRVGGRCCPRPVGNHGPVRYTRQCRSRRIGKDAHFTDHPTYATVRHPRPGSINARL